MMLPRQLFFRDNLPSYIMSTGETSQYCNITERYQHGVGACHVPQRVQKTFFSFQNDPPNYIMSKEHKF